MVIMIVMAALCVILIIRSEKWCDHLCCSIDGYSQTHTGRVTSSSSFCVTPHTPAGNAGARSDLLRAVHNRATITPGLGVPASDTSPSRASPANSNTSPRDSQASVTSTSSSASSRVSDANKDTTGLIELKQQVCMYGCNLLLSENAS